MYTVGLKEGGTVVAVGMNHDSLYFYFSENWNEIVSVSSGDYHTIGLKADSTVPAVGANIYGECDVGSWSNIKVN